LSKYRQWIVLSLLLLLLGGLIFTYKVVRLGFPVRPDLTSKAWTIQVRLEIQPEDGPVRAELRLPSHSRGFTLSRENFISRGFGLTLDEETFSRQAHWAVRELREPRTLVLPGDGHTRNEAAKICQPARESTGTAAGRTLCHRAYGHRS